MKKLIIIILSLSTTVAILCSCSLNGNSEIESLKKEVETLKQQIGELQSGNNSTKSTSSPASKSTTAPKSNQDAKIDDLIFELSEEDRTSHGEEVIMSYKVTNNTEKIISYYSVSIAYYDVSGTMLNMDSRFNDAVLKPGMSAITKSYSNVNGDKASVATSKIISYYYITTEADENGNNKFEVNIETGKTKSSYDKNR